MKNRLLCVLSFLAFSAPVCADAPYILGQLGAYNQADWKDYRYTGRIALGYHWDTSLVLGDCAEDLNFLAFNYGFEVGYQHYQQNNLSYSVENYGEDKHFYNTTIKRESYDLLAVLDIAPDCLFDVFIKFGAAIVTQKINMGHIQIPIYDDPLDENVYASKDTRIVPKIIVGLGLNVWNNVNFNVAYTHEFQTDSVKSIAASPMQAATTPTSLVPPISALMFGIQYSF